MQLNSKHTWENSKVLMPLFVCFCHHGPGVDIKELHHYKDFYIAHESTNDL